MDHMFLELTDPPQSIKHTIEHSLTLSYKVRWLTVANQRGPKRATKRAAQPLPPECKATIWGFEHTTFSIWRYTHVLPPFHSCTLICVILHFIRKKTQK